MHQQNIDLCDVLYLWLSLSEVYQRTAVHGSEEYDCNTVVYRHPYLPEALAVTGMTTKFYLQLVELHSVCGHQSFLQAILAKAEL